MSQEDMSNASPYQQNVGSVYDNSQYQDMVKFDEKLRGSTYT